MSEKKTNLEPEAVRLVKEAAQYPDGVKLIAVMSIAISLKRIADELSYQPDGASNNIFDLMNDIRHNTRGSQ